MNHQVLFRPIAREQAVQAADYIAEHGSPEIAAIWFEGLVQAVDSLAHHPHRCGAARENNSFPDIELRQLVYKSHRVIFTIRDDVVHVLQIRHTARDDLESFTQSD